MQFAGWSCEAHGGWLRCEASLAARLAALVQAASSVGSWWSSLRENLWRLLDRGNQSSYNARLSPSATISYELFENRSGILDVRGELVDPRLIQCFGERSTLKFL
jgi:hypothetical protein